MLLRTFLNTSSIGITLCSESFSLSRLSERSADYINLRMAAEYHLNLLYMKEFHQVFEEHQEHPEFKPLMLRMKVVDDNGESAMDEDQWEAASM